MSRKPNDTTTTRKSGAKKTGSKKPKSVKTKKKKIDVEETPITISGGSINVDSKLNRKGGVGILNHKKCRIPNVSSDKPWTLKSVGIYGPGMSWPDDNPLESIDITNPDYSVVVIFQRPE